MPKIGIMGGTFNPIHNGHLAIAQKACTQFDLDKVIFITGGNPPHKKDQKILDAQTRHKMVSMAIRNYKKFEPCDYEVKKGSYSYTFETLKYIKRTENKADLYFIIGADSLHNITSWYKPRAIMELATLLVYGREGFDTEADLKEIKKGYYCKVDFIESENIDISSTALREALVLGKDISDFVPGCVNEFIARNGLYKREKGSLRQRLKKRLKSNRYNHSIAVSDTAVKLARLYGVDTDKAYVAGLLHDCAKNLPLEEMLRKCEDYDVFLDEYEKNNSALIHAKLGEAVARVEFGISDGEILEAIKWHTLGCGEMSVLSKIIYVADMIEPNRHFDGIEELRRLSVVDLNKAVIACTNATISFTTSRKKDVHPMAYKLLEEIKNQGELLPVENS